MDDFPAWVSVTVNVNLETLAAVQSVVDREGVTVTEAVRRLISYGNVVYAASRSVDRVLLVSGDGSAREVVVL